VTSRYFPWYGGAEVFVREMIKRMPEHEHRIITTTARTVEETFVPNRLPSSRDVVEGTPVERHPCLRPPGFWNIARALDTGLGLYLYGPNSMGQISSLFRSNYDMIHCCPFVGTHNIYGFLAGQMRRKKIIFTPCIHTRDTYHFERKYLFEMLKRATRVNALTNHERKFLISHGVPSEKIFVTGMGVDPDEFQKVKTLDLGEDFLISFVGRLDKHKGIYDLMKAVAELDRVKLLVVGEPVGGFVQFYEALRPETRQKILLYLDTPERKIGRPYVLSLIKSSDVFCLPSSVESFGAVYLEAMILGKPVIARRTEVSEEVIEDAGLFIDDQSSLVRSLRRLMMDTALHRELGRRGRQRVFSKYTWDVIADRFRKNTSAL